jgi:hypothetical protein
MLEKSLGLMFFLKQPRNYDGGEMYNQWQFKKKDLTVR